MRDAALIAALVALAAVGIVVHWLAARRESKRHSEHLDADRRHHAEVIKRMDEVGKERWQLRREYDEASERWKSTEADSADLWTEVADLRRRADATPGHAPTDRPVPERRRHTRRQ